MVDPDVPLHAVVALAVRRHARSRIEITGIPGTQLAQIASVDFGNRVICIDIDLALYPVPVLRAGGGRDEPDRVLLEGAPGDPARRMPDRDHGPAPGRQRVLGEHLFGRPVLGTGRAVRHAVELHAGACELRTYAHAAHRSGGGPRDATGIVA